MSARSYITAGGVFLLSLLAAMWIACIFGDSIVSFYGNSLQQALFAAFVTLSAFLFSLMTFIIVKMKEEVYGTDSYREKFESQKKLNDALELYGPLRNFSELLFFTVVLCLVAAITQFTVGFIEHWWAVVLSVASAISAFCMFAISLFHVWRNISAFFEHLGS